MEVPGDTSEVVPGDTSEPSPQVRPRRERKGRPVYQISVFDGRAIRRWDRVNTAAKHVGVSSSTLSRAATRGTIRKGYIWKYADEVEFIQGEVWKEIPGGWMYKASSMGRIRCPNGRITTGFGKDYSRRYCFIRKNVYLDEVIAKTFLRGSGEVVHINGNVQDSRVENLRYSRPPVV